MADSDLRRILDDNVSARELMAATQCPPRVYEFRDRWFLHRAVIIEWETGTRSYGFSFRRMTRWGLRREIRRRLAEIERDRERIQRATEKWRVRLAVAERDREQQRSKLSEQSWWKVFD